jgi:hypothetical protein
MLRACGRQFLIPSTVHFLQESFEEFEGFYAVFSARKPLGICTSEFTSDDHVEESYCEPLRKQVKVRLQYKVYITSDSSCFNLLYCLNSSMQLPEWRASPHVHTETC